MYNSIPDIDLPDPERQAAFYEGVPIKRGVAWLFDTVIIFAITLPLAVFSIIGLWFIPLIYIIVGFFYRWMTMAGGSATWGMRMMAIEFRDIRGQRLDSGQAFLHTLGYSISITTFVLQIGSIIAMFVTERGQSLTDLVLGTVALNRRA